MEHIDLFTCSCDVHAHIIRHSKGELWTPRYFRFFFFRLASEFVVPGPVVNSKMEVC
jgi:hypothetical protein